MPPGSRFLFEAEVGVAGIAGEHLTVTNWEGEFDDGGMKGVSHNIIVFLNPRELLFRLNSIVVYIVNRRCIVF